MRLLIGFNVSKNRDKDKEPASRRQCHGGSDSADLAGGDENAFAFLLPGADVTGAFSVHAHFRAAGAFSSHHRIRPGVVSLFIYPSFFFFLKSFIWFFFLRHFLNKNKSIKRRILPIFAPTLVLFHRRFNHCQHWIMSSIIRLYATPDISWNWIQKALEFLGLFLQKFKPNDARYLLPDIS